MTPAVRLAQLLFVLIAVAGCTAAGGATAQTTPPTEAPTFVLPTARPTTTPSVGSGVITFGKGYNPNTLAVIGPAGTFKTSSTKVAWSAEFVEEANTTTLTFILASRNSGGAESIILKEQHDLSNPQAVVVANDGDLPGLVGRKPGTYVMRYLRGGTILAEGTFRLVK